MKEFELEITMRVPLRAYSDEDAVDQGAAIGKEMPRFLEALEDIGVRLVRWNFPITSGLVGEGDPRAKIISKEELIHLLSKQHEEHQVQEWVSRFREEGLTYRPRQVSLRHAFADIEHRQWSHWSGGLVETLERARDLLRPTLREQLTGSESKQLRDERAAFANEIKARIERWARLKNTPYGDLDKKEQEDDLVWADEAMGAVMQHLEEGWPR